MTALLPILEVPQSHSCPQTPRKIKREGSPAAQRKIARSPALHIIIILLITLTAIAGHTRLSNCSKESPPEDELQVPLVVALRSEDTTLAPFFTPIPIHEDSFGSLILYCGGNWFDNWYGRTGNNILSVFNAALTAKMLGLKFAIRNCSHSIMDLTPLTIDHLQGVKDEKQLFLTPTDAFYLHMDPETGLTLPLEACCMRRSILTPLVKHLTTANSAAASKRYSPDALVIHIRSGDIFDKEGSIHPSYSPPPLAYYQEIIEEHSIQSREIVLVTQNDHMSPLVAPLLEIYPHIKIQAGSLEEDVAVVLAARHLVVSQGTFAWALGLASSKLETLYTFNGDLDYRAFCNADVVRFTTSDWMIKEWTASDAQIEYLLDFPRGSMRKSILRKQISC